MPILVATDVAARGLGKLSFHSRMCTGCFHISTVH